MASTIDTARLEIRPWMTEEAGRLLDMLRHPEVSRWFSGPPMQTCEEALARIERYRKTHAEDPRFGAWAVIERASGIAAGTVLLQPLPNGGGEIEIGWHLHPDSWGHGYATEAAAALLDQGFGYGLAEIWAVTDPANERSMAVCRRIGMRLLGITDRWYEDPSMMFWAAPDPAAVPSIAPDREAFSE